MGASESLLSLTFIPEHATAFTWFLGITSAAVFAIILFVALQSGGLAGVLRWIDRNSDENRAGYTRRVMREGHQLYTREALRLATNGGRIPPSDPGLDAEAGKWLGAIFDWFEHEHRRRRRVFRARFSAWLLPAHMFAAWVSVALYNFDMKASAGFAYSVAIAMVALASSVFWAAPLFVDTFRRGVPRSEPQGDG